VRYGSNLLTRLWQVNDDDKKHDRQVCGRTEAKASMSVGKDACDQLFFPKITLLIFSVFILIALSNASSFSLHLKHRALRNRYVSLGIERGSFSR